MSKKMENSFDHMYALLKVVAADVVQLKEMMLKQQHGLDMILVQKPAVTANNEGILLPFSEEKARTIIRNMFMRRSLGDRVNALWANLGTIFSMNKFTSTDQVAKCREKMGFYHSEQKHKLKESILELREKMDEEDRKILKKEDTQYQKFTKYLQENKLESLIEGFDLAPVTQEEVNTAWTLCDTDIVKANIGMEILTSLLCGVEEPKFHEIFKDSKRIAFKNLDTLLIIQPVAELFINKFAIAGTPFTHQNMAGSKKRSREPGMDGEEDNDDKKPRTDSEKKM